MHEYQAGVAASLTKRQKQIYDFLVGQQSADPQETPTLDELCEALGLSSRGSMHKHVMALIDAGLLPPWTASSVECGWRSMKQPTTTSCHCMVTSPPAGPSKLWIAARRS